MKGYKGFDKDLKCRDFQYKVGETYEQKDKPVCCDNGFHFCENPLDVLGYYPIIDEEGKHQRYCEVEAIGEIDKEKNSDDTKVCTNKIKIGVELSFEKLVKAGINFVYEHAKKSKTPGAHKRTDSSVASNTGDSSVASNTGDRSVASNTGYSSVASNTGDSSVASNTGDRSVASNTGYSSVASNTGYSSVASNTGDKGIASSLGIEGKAKAKKGNWLVLAEWILNKNNYEYEIKEVKAILVDGKKVKEDTLYQLIDGKITEVNE